MASLRGRECKRFCRVLACAALASSAQAHDFWIEPGTFHAQVGTKVPLRLHVGNDFKGDAALYNAEQFNRYVYAVGAGPEQKVPGQLGDDPAGAVPVEQPGLYAAIYDSKKFDVKFDDFNKFQDYLKDEGLERHMPFAKARAGNGGRITEIYSRCAKTLIAAPQAETATAGHDFHCALELVAESNPYRTRDVKLRLLFKGQPVEGVLVQAFSKADPANKMRVRTDREGRVALSLPAGGVWLVKAVHMVAMARFVRGDWESFWASLTFEAP
jgi:hypothetical protein